MKKKSKRKTKEDHIITFSLGKIIKRDGVDCIQWDANTFVTVDALTQGFKQYKNK